MMRNIVQLPWRGTMLAAQWLNIMPLLVVLGRSVDGMWWIISGFKLKTEENQPISFWRLLAIVVFFALIRRAYLDSLLEISSWGCSLMKLLLLSGKGSLVFLIMQYSSLPRNTSQVMWCPDRKYSILRWVQHPNSHKGICMTTLWSRRAALRFLKMVQQQVNLNISRLQMEITESVLPVFHTAKVMENGSLVHHCNLKMGWGASCSPNEWVGYFLGGRDR